MGEIIRRFTKIKLPINVWLLGLSLKEIHRHSPPASISLQLALVSRQTANETLPRLGSHGLTPRLHIFPIPDNPFHRPLILHPTRPVAHLPALNPAIELPNQQFQSHWIFPAIKTDLANKTALKTYAGHLLGAGVNVFSDHEGYEWGVVRGKTLWNCY